MYYLSAINDVLNKLRRGFGKADDNVSLLLEQWNSKIGGTTDSLSRDEQCIRFESNIPIRLRGFGFACTLLLGEDCAAMRRAVSRLATDTSNGRVRGIALCLTDSSFRYMRTASIPSGRLVTLSRDDVRSILTAQAPSDRLCKYIRNQLAFRRLVPFSTSDPTEGHMFVGRKNELKMLIEENQDYALCGPGGMGKTSLLRQMRWVMRRERDLRHERLVEVDLIACDPNVDAAAQAIATRVQSTSFAQGLAVDKLESFFKRMRVMDARFHDGPIDLIIDEIDTILGRDRLLGYPLMKALRHARQMGLIRLTISGRTETDMLLKDSQNPFTVDTDRKRSHPSRLKLVNLSPLTNMEASDLLFTPLRELGIDVEGRKSDLSEELALCGGVPYEIQNLGLDVANSFANSGERAAS